MKGSTSSCSGNSITGRGSTSRPCQFLEQGFTIGHAHDLQLIVIWIVWVRGLTYGGQGEYAAALAALQEALALSDRLGDKVCKCRILNTLGWVHGEILQPGGGHPVQSGGGRGLIQGWRSRDHSERGD